MKVFQRQYGVHVDPILLTRGVMNSDMNSLDLHKDC